MNVVSPWRSLGCGTSGIDRTLDGYLVDAGARGPVCSGPLRILGIDPGLLRTGFGIIERSGNQARHIVAGAIRIPSNADLPLRLKAVFEGIQAVIREYQPDGSAIEEVFVNVNPRATLLLGQARGAAIAALTTADLPVAEYTALQIKKAVTGHGRASKEQIQRLVCALLKLDEAPSQDAADALACALCHANSSHTADALSLAAGNGQRAMTLRRGRVSADTPTGLPPALAALGLRVRRGRLVSS